jgi:2',3'-cyclic-nucleotide 2'-phosphodiesterase (5'-nucleotidase family)
MPSADARLDREIAGWAARVEKEMGEVIGFTKMGFPKNADALAVWIADAWRKPFAADVAVNTRGAIRQELPPGKITVATVASILPFENELVLIEVPGAALEKLLRNPEAMFSGLARKGDRLVDSAGHPLDPARRYKVVTTDFLFYGGDGFAFKELDEKPTFTSVGWRDPVIAWMRETPTSEARPLETMLAPH